MKKALIAFCLLICMVFVVSCGSKTDTSVTTAASDSQPETLTEKYWYIMGTDLISYYSEYYNYYYDDFDVKAFAKGMADFANDSLLYSDEEIQAIATEYYEETEKAEAETAAKNLEIAEQFLAENATKEGVKTTASGLQYKVISEGNGERPSATDTVEVNYSLNLADGAFIESTFMAGTPAKFALTEVIDGFSEGVQLMPVGSTYEFYIHPDIGYGSVGSGLIEANSLLIFNVQLLSIVE